MTMKTYKSKKGARKFKDGKEVKEVKKRTKRNPLKELLMKRRADRELERRMRKPKGMMERPKLGNDERVRSRMKPIKRKRGLGY